MKNNQASQTAPRTSLEKALQLLELLSENGNEQTLNSLSKASTIHISTVHRLLEILERREYVFRNPKTKGYRLGIKNIHLGESARRHISLINEAQSVLEELTAKTGETSSLDMIINNRSTIMSQVVGTPPTAVQSVVGAQVHMHACATGKVLLSGMTIDRVDRILSEGLIRFTPNTITDHEQLMSEIEVIRKRGYAFDNEERFIGVRCIAVPIYDHTNKIIAAIHISSPVNRMSEENFLELIPAVVEAGIKLSSRLGWKSNHNGEY